MVHLDLKSLSELGFLIVFSAPESWTLETPEGEFLQVSPYFAEGRATQKDIAKAKRQAKDRSFLKQLLTTQEIENPEPSAPLILAESATPGVLNKAQNQETNIFTVEPARLIFSGKTWGTPLEAKTASPPQPKIGWMQLALIRLLLLSCGSLQQQEIAEILNIRQPYVSRLLKELREKHGLDLRLQGVEVRKRVLDFFLAAYPQKFLAVQHWTSSTALAHQTSITFHAFDSHSIPLLATAELAADQYAPWKHPEGGIFYTLAPLDLEEEGLLEVSAEDSTIEVRIAKDPTIFATAQWWNDFCASPKTGYVDPLITLADLSQSTRSDDQEAAQKLYSYVLNLEGSHGK